MHDVSYKVIIFSDEEQPLSQAQIQVIKTLIPGVQVHLWPKSMGWGATQIKCIWQAYQLVAEYADDNDIIARIDSDVFFFNNRIFQAVIRSDADLVGDGHFVNFRFCQGGCYFFRASAVRKITAMLNSEGLEEILKEVDVVVEDVAASHFAKRLGLSVLMTWIMMFPDELRNAGRFTAWVRWKFSCAHFVMKNKSIMLEFYENELMAPESLTDFKRVLETQ